MEGGALFKVRSEAKERVLAAFAAIDIRKNEVGGYAYNDANMLVTEIERVLAEQLFEDSTDGMMGLLSTATNTLTEYKATISIKRKDVLKDSKDAAARLSSSSGTTVQPEIVTNSDAQEEADRQNTYRLAAIGVKEGVAAGITKIVGKDITNPILRTSDGISFKSVDQYQLHQLVTTITEGAERPEATTIRQQFVNIAGTEFDWRDTVAINVETFATNAAKTQAYGIRGTQQKQTSRKEQRQYERRGKGTKCHRLQILRQTRRQWFRARSAKEHPTRQMQFQPQIQRLEAKVGMQQDGNQVQGVG